MMNFRSARSFVLSGLLVFLAIYFGLHFFYKPKRQFTYTRGIYDWSGWYQLEYADTLHIQKYYQKFFEVGLDNLLQPVPVDEIVDYDIANRSRTVDYTEYYRDTIVKTPHYLVPCVYIHQAVFLQKNLNTADLAKKIMYLLEYKLSDYDSKNAARINEFQIDCDWPASGQNAYFDFLRAFKKELRARRKYANFILSATLRLYPYKFPEKMGYLPVDRAMLMCYNLQPPDPRGQECSIFSLKVLRAYLEGASAYPLPIDIALPHFSLAFVYENGQFQRLFRNVGAEFRGLLHHDKGLWYTVQKDSLISTWNDDFYLRKGQRVKIETVPLPELKQALRLIDRNVVFHGRPTLSFFSIENLSNANAATLKGLDRLYRTRP
jgi:hypothetical protein